MPSNKHFNVFDLESTSDSVVNDYAPYVTETTTPDAQGKFFRYWSDGSYELVRKDGSVSMTVHPIK